MTRPHVLSLLWCALVLGQLGVASAATGTITGQLTHPMAQTAIHDAVVWAEPVGDLPTFPPPAQPAEMAQVQLAFTPRVLPVLVGTTVDFPNRDTVYHSVFSFARQQRFEIGLYPPGESRTVTFDTPGLVKVFCNIHDQMFGAILVLSTPYFSTSTPGGTFTLANVPPGTYTVQVWHARPQGAPHTVTVTAGATTTLALVVAAQAPRGVTPHPSRGAPGMRWSLRSKIFALMGSMVLGFLVVTLLVVGWQAHRRAWQRIVDDLHSTRRQFEALQQLRYQHLLALSRILGREYALRNALATYDPPTVFSAMQTFQARIQSDVFLITDDRGSVLAATSGSTHPGHDLSQHPAVQAALRGEETLHIWQVQDVLSQVATVPLYAGPDILGTLSVGYAIDQDFLRELQTLTGSAITVLAGQTLLASTWPAAVQPALVQALVATAWMAPSLAHAPQDIHVLSLEGETYLSLAVSLYAPQQQPVGRYILQKSLDQELAALYHLQRTLLGTGLAALIGAVVSSFFLAQGVTAPVQALVQGAMAVGRGDYQYRVTVRMRDELGVLARAYNTMTEQLAAQVTALQTAYRELQQQTQALEASLRKIALLEQAKIHLSKFVPASVTRLIETAPDAPALDKRDRDVTVLFLDIAGYTRLSAQHSRDTMNALVERYFSSFLDAIYTYNGDINETAGDGLMMLFQDDDPQRHATNAVLTALAIQRQTRALNRTAAPADVITINIGINSGIAAVGSTRFEGLTGTRWTYTASGPVTNIAARLAELATHGEIYVGETTAQRVQERFQLRALGTHDAKNIPEPLLVYAIAPDENPA